VKLGDATLYPGCRNVRPYSKLAVTNDTLHPRHSHLCLLASIAFIEQGLLEIFNMPAQQFAGGGAVRVDQPDLDEPISNLDRDAFKPPDQFFIHIVMIMELTITVRLCIWEKQIRIAASLCR